MTGRAATVSQFSILRMRHARSGTVLNAVLIMFIRITVVLTTSDSYLRSPILTILAPVQRAVCSSSPDVEREALSEGVPMRSKTSCCSDGRRALDGPSASPLLARVPSFRHRFPVHVRRLHCRWAVE